MPSYNFRTSESIASRVVRNRRAAAVDALARMTEMADHTEEVPAPSPAAPTQTRQQIQTPGWRLASSAPCHRYMLRSMRRNE